MRVGFIGDPVTSVRAGVTFRKSPLSLLDEVPIVWRGAPPSASGDVYAGIAILDTAQVTLLLSRATLAGIQLALVLDVDGAEATQPFSTAEKDRLTTWLVPKGLPGPRVMEAQLDYVERIQQLLNPSDSMDKTLAAVAQELTVRR